MSEKIVEILDDLKYPALLSIVQRLVAVNMGDMVAFCKLKQDAHEVLRDE